MDIPLSNIEDSVCWGLHSSGKFTTRSATWLAHSTKPLSQPDWDIVPLADFSSRSSCA